VPSKWYRLLAQGTCVIDRNNLQNLFKSSIKCKEMLELQKKKEHVKFMHIIL